MEERMKNMLNKLEANRFLIANPFSKLGNENLNNLITKELFFEKLHVVSNKTNDRLFEFLKIKENPTTNSIFMTGYRGCGKTTFIRYLESIIENNNDNKNSCFDDEKLVELKRLTGCPIYVNFEKGTNEIDNPIEHKLNQGIKHIIKELYLNIAQKNDVFNSIVEIYSKCEEELNLFERSSKYIFNNFFEFIIRAVKIDSYNEIKKELDENISLFSISELLCVYVIFNILCYPNDHYYFLFDNIDIIFDLKILEDFVEAFAHFVVNMSELISATSEYGLLNNFNFYSNATFVFVMRETSSTLISDHFWDRLNNFSTHFDISSDSDKSSFIEKRLNYLINNKNEITNDKLFNTVKNINLMCKDWYVKNNMFPLFNNDYKRTINCLCEILKNNEDLIQEYFDFMKLGNEFNRHGARGILFRLIFENFKTNHYFEKIGIDSEYSKKSHLTVSRLILIYMLNRQPKHNDHFLIDLSDTISMKTLYSAFEGIIGNDNISTQNALIDSLWGMYDLRKSKSWNHLITFDTIKTIKKDNLIKYFEDNHDAQEIRLRLTCAGRMYILLVCVHFEFFACRFADEFGPLFSKENEKYNIQKQKYPFEIMIETVLNKVKVCCNNLNIFKQEKFQNQSREEFLKDDYVYHNEKNRANDKENLGATHAERLLHQHIQYIDAYRLTLIKGTMKDNVKDINKRLLKLIDEYLELMNPEHGKNGYFYSDNNYNLYYQLKACSDLLKDKDYDSNSIEINRKYCIDHNLKLEKELR